MKFFGFELGAQTVGNERYLIGGSHDLETITILLDQFILKYVLCKRCGNPETDFSVKKETLSLRCKACGHLSPCDPNHKFSNYLIKAHSRK
jgi:translation initiation factor 5